MERLRSRFPDTLVLGFDPEGAGAAAKASYSSRLAEAEDDLSVCCGFLEHVRGRPADPTPRQLSSPKPSSPCAWKESPL